MATVPTVAAGPVTGFGSVFVSGNEFDTNGAVITVDGQTNAGEGQLKKGMVVLVNGTISEDYGTGQAVRRAAKTVLYEDTIEGPVQSVALDGLSLIVLGQTVIINQSTIIDLSIPTLSSLSPDDLVEVSGFVSGPGTVVATLIDRKSKKEAVDYQVKGFITQHDKDLKSFTIGSLAVDYTDADISQMPNPAEKLWNGLLVDVRGSQSSQGGQGPNGIQLTATRVKTESLATENIPEAEIEGIVTLLTSPTEFYIGNMHVQTTSSTGFENGTAAEIVPGATMEVEGPIVNGILIAAQVEFKDSVLVESDVATLTISTDDSGTLTLTGFPGVMVAVSSATKVEGENSLRRFSDINVSDHLKVRGHPGSNNTVIATELVRASPSTTVVLQGPVDSTANPSLEILGVTIDTSSILDSKFKGAGDVPIGRGVFFATLTSKTLVEIKGNWGGGLVSWEEAKLHK